MSFFFFFSPIICISIRQVWYDLLFSYFLKKGFRILYLKSYLGVVN